MENRGIDYGRGQTNRNQETGIRYGVIAHHQVGTAWYEESTPVYPNACPHCGDENPVFFRILDLQETSRLVISYTKDDEPIALKRQRREENDEWYDGHSIAIIDTSDSTFHIEQIEIPENVKQLPRRYACCEHPWQDGDTDGIDPSHFIIDNATYAATQGADDSDIFILRSPYMTYATLCSPCAPGACSLMAPLDEPVDNNRAYCFGHDMFENGVAPYPVYDVEAGRLVAPKEASV